MQHHFGPGRARGIISTHGSAASPWWGHGNLARNMDPTIYNLVEADVVLRMDALSTVMIKKMKTCFGRFAGRGQLWRCDLIPVRAHPVKTVYAGPVFWSPDRSVRNSVVSRIIPTASEDLFGFFSS